MNFIGPEEMIAICKKQFYEEPGNCWKLEFIHSNGHFFIDFVNCSHSRQWQEFLKHCDSFHYVSRLPPRMNHWEPCLMAKYTFSGLSQSCCTNVLKILPLYTCICGSWIFHSQMMERCLIISCGCALMYLPMIVYLYIMYIILLFCYS